MGWNLVSLQRRQLRERTQSTSDARAVRRIRSRIREMPERSVILFEDETDVMVFPSLRSVTACRMQQHIGWATLLEILNAVSRSDPMFPASMLYTRFLQRPQFGSARVRIMKRLPGNRTRSFRRGFTLLELLVSLGVIAILVSILLPATLNARESARRLQCQSRLRNLGLAIHGYEQTLGRLPPAGTFSAVGPGQFTNWVIELFPWIEQSNISNEWNNELPRNVSPNLELSRTPLALLVCPSDATALAGMPNLSYVANGGFGWTEPVDCPVTMHLYGIPPQSGLPIDLNGNGVLCPSFDGSDGSPTDRELYFWTGLFFVENAPPGTGTVRHHRFDRIVDGLTNTIMISENVRAGVDPNEQETTGWSSTMARRNCFFVSGYVCEDLECADGKVDYARANAQSHPLYKSEAINAARELAEGQAPWPSSFHTAGVNVLFVDGRVQFFSESVDGEVYASLVSPRGSTIQGPLLQTLVTGGEY